MSLDKSTGILLFESLEAFEEFLESLDDGPEPEVCNFGGVILSLNLEPRSKVPAGMRREAKEHGWHVAGPKAWPMVECRDGDGTPRPLSDHEVRIVTACATSLSTFFMRHREDFAAGEIDNPLCESYFDNDGLEVRFTVPYDAAELFDLEPAAGDPGRVQPPAEDHVPAAADQRARALAAPGAPKIGRNQPCPCGSGKTYKRCCLP